MEYRSVLSVMVCAVGVLAAVNTQATSITVNNADFDHPAGGAGVGANSGSFFPTTKWNGTPASGDIGLYTPAYIGLPSGYPVAANIHTGLAYIARSSGASFTGQLWQTTGALFENGTYTLTVQTALTPSSGVPFVWPNDAEIQLYAGTNVTTGTLLKQVTVPSMTSAGFFQTNSLTFGPADANFATLFAAHQLEPLTVSFYLAGSGAGRSEVDWDNVTFDFVPEPTAAILAGMSALLLIRRRRK